MYTLKLKLSKIVSNKSKFQVMARFDVADHISLEEIVELFQLSVENVSRLNLENIAKAKKVKKRV